MARAETPRVTSRVSERTRFPAAGVRPEDDVRSQVTLELPEFAPWTLRFDFIRYIESDDSGHRTTFEFAGFELGRLITLAEAEACRSALLATRLPGRPPFVPAFVQKAAQTRAP